MNKPSRDEFAAEDSVEMRQTAPCPSPVVDQSHLQLSAALAGAEIARELNGGDRRDCSYPPELVSLLDDPSIDNEAALARWAASIIAKRFSASNSITQDSASASELSRTVLDQGSCPHYHQDRLDQNANRCWECKAVLITTASLPESSAVPESQRPETKHYATFESGWNAGFQEALEPDRFPDQNRCEVLYRELFTRLTTPVVIEVSKCCRVKVEVVGAASDLYQCPKCKEILDPDSEVVPVVEENQNEQS